MKRVDLSGYQHTYRHDKNYIIRVLWYIINKLFFFNSIPFPVNIKIKLLKVFGASVGRNVVIKPNVSIKFPWLLSVADNTWIGEFVWIDNLGEVSIGSNCCISQGAYLLTGNHNYKSKNFDLIVGDITINDGAWIGAKAIVCPNVTVGFNSVLTAGSVANKDIESNSIYQGNPAKKNKNRIIDEVN